MVLGALALAVLLASPANAVMVEIMAPPELAAPAARLRALVAAENFSDLAGFLGLAEFGGTVRVVLASEHSELAQRAPTWVAGYANPAVGEVVLFPTRVPSYPDRTLAALLRHELAHVLTGRAVGHRPLPAWLAEGIATVAAREWGLEDRARYAAAVIGPGPRSLAELEADFRAGGRRLPRAYALSAACIRSLVRRHGAEVVPRLLAGLARGEDLSLAFAAATGTSLAAFEHRFFHADAFWTTWVPFLTSSGALWMGITLLALLAIRRRRQRDAQLRARWAAEEAALHSSVEPSMEPQTPDDPRRYN